VRAQHITKEHTNILVVLGRGLARLAVPQSGKLLALLGRDLALSVQVTLVADNDDGHPVGSSVVQNLVTNNLDHVKAQLARHRVDQNITVDIQRMFSVEN
jgi:hypothetical protein